MEKICFKLSAINESSIVSQVQAKVGDVTILINNAGIVTGKKFSECSDELMVKTMEVNAIAHFWVCINFHFVS